MRELAALAGVSLNTVSLALKDHSRISKPVREHLRKLAVETGYRPDTVVSTLMARLRTTRKQRFSETIAFLSMCGHISEWADNVHYYYEGACRRADELGYQLETFFAGEEGMTQHKMSRVLMTRDIRGIVLAPLPQPMGRLSFDWQHFAATRIGYSITYPDLDRSLHDHYGGMVLALRELRKLGYQRPGFCTLESQDRWVAHRWRAAYLMYFHVNDGERKPEVAPLLLQRWNKKKLLAWIREQKPDVVISNMSQIADQIRELSIAIPEKIGFVNLDLHHRHGAMAGIDQCPTEIGATAVELVAAHLTHNQFGIPHTPKTVLLNGYWVHGDTIRPRTS